MKTAVIAILLGMMIWSTWHWATVIPQRRTFNASREQYDKEVVSCIRDISPSQHELEVLKYKAKELEDIWRTGEKERIKPFIDDLTFYLLSLAQGRCEDLSGASDRLKDALL